MQCGASTNLATEEVEDEDATENFEQICSPQHQNLSDVEDVDPPMDFEGVDDIHTYTYIHTHFIDAP